jgi:hypothetical protein
VGIALFCIIFQRNACLLVTCHFIFLFQKNWLGAAFFDFDGNFVGMNHFKFLPPRIILEQSTSMQWMAFRYIGMNGWFETIRYVVLFAKEQLIYDSLDC